MHVSNSNCATVYRLCRAALTNSGVQAFCHFEQCLMFVVQNMFQTAAWDPSASDLPRISRAEDWLTGAFLMAMWNSVRELLFATLRLCAWVRVCMCVYGTHVCVCMARMCVCTHRQHNVTLTIIYKRQWGCTASVYSTGQRRREGVEGICVSRSVCENMPNVWVFACMCVWEREGENDWGGYSSLRQLTVLEDPSSDPDRATQRCQAQHTQVGHTAAEGTGETGRMLRLHSCSIIGVLLVLKLQHSQA